MNSNEKQRLYGLDILRIASATVVCAFHTHIHLNANYGFLTTFISKGALFMTLFFMLSGYSMYIGYSNKSFSERTNFINFLKKRFVGIVPMYWIVSSVYTIIEVVKTGGGALKQTILLLPIELLGIQSAFESLFLISHNGGTWFISCILICYLIYPYLQEFTQRASKMCRLKAMLICIAILLYSPIVVWYFGLNGIYSNPLFRMLEFIIGVFWASFKSNIESNNRIRNYIMNWFFACFVFVILIFLVSIAVRLGIDDYMMLSWIGIPCFMLLIMSLSGVSFKHDGFKRIVYRISESTYCLFLAQLFSNAVAKWFICRIDIHSNGVFLVTGWSICMGIAFILRIIEKKIKPVLMKQMIAGEKSQ